MNTYRLECNVRQNDTLRESFNDLTQKVFCFNFRDWYDHGYWTDGYQPYCFVDGERVVANISVNHIKFLVDGVTRTFLQLGTVMTDPDYRGQGLSRKLMEYILASYPIGDSTQDSSVVDGIYLFGNDSVKEFYPKFGFQVSSQKEPYLTAKEFVAMGREATSDNTLLPPMNLWCDAAAREKMEKLVANRWPNEAFSMVQNPYLNLFWLTGEYGESVYYNPLQDAYAVIEQGDNYVKLVEVEADHEVDIKKLLVAIAGALAGGEERELGLGFSPVKGEGFHYRERNVEDCTYFILGEQLKALEERGWMYSELSHA